MNKTDTNIKNKSQYKCSIVIPCYNVSEYLDDFLKNIPLNNKIFKFIFIDDCSTDNTLALLKKYKLKNKNIKLISLKVNKGAAMAINEGVKYMNTNWYARLDPDDIVFKEYFQEIPKYLNDSNVLIRYKFKILKENEIKTPHFLWKLYFKQAWGWTCIMNVNALSKPSWDRRMMFDDMYAFASIYKNTNKKQIFVDKYLAAYRVNRPGSVMSSTKYESRLKDLQLAYNTFKNNKDIKITFIIFLLLLRIRIQMWNLKRKIKKLR